jgi:hypothetical protein
MIKHEKKAELTNMKYRHTAVIHLTQNISPCIFPSFIQLQVPAITTLHFKETDQDSGLLKIYRQEDSWTLEGK